MFKRKFLFVFSLRRQDINDKILIERLKGAFCLYMEGSHKRFLRRGQQGLKFNQEIVVAYCSELVTQAFLFNPKCDKGCVESSVVSVTHPARVHFLEKLGGVVFLYN